MASLFSILKFSGRHWSRAALGWLLFALAVQGLARAGAEGADAERAAYDTAVALGFFDGAGDRQVLQGQIQVAGVSVKDFEIDRLAPDAFGDTADLPPAY